MNEGEMKSCIDTSVVFVHSLVRLTSLFLLEPLQSRLVLVYICRDRRELPPNMSDSYLAEEETERRVLLLRQLEYDFDLCTSPGGA